MVQRVLVTGGGGAIGYHVVRRIVETTNWQVTVLDSFRHKGYRDRLNLLRREVPEAADRVTELQHDLTCPISPELADRIGYVDHVLHLAAISDVFYSVENPVHVVMNNLTSTLTMLEYARSLGEDLATFLYFSTDEVYGPVERGDAHPEGEPHRPSNAYAASKAASEDVCYAWWRSYDVPLIVTNTMNNFGETQSPSKFPAMVQHRVARGETVTVHGTKWQAGTRFYVDSADVADALIHILRELPPTRHARGELDEPDRYHLVGERAVSNLELARLVAGLMGEELDYELVDFHRDNPAHDIHYGLVNTRLHGWRPRPLEEGLKRVIGWQRDNPEWL